jgi:chromatin structure-remodeling complex subunit SFH1
MVRQSRASWNQSNVPLTFSAITSLLDVLHLAEPFITPRQFASVFCEDLSIPLDPYATTMAELIQAQLDEATGQGVIEVDILDEQAGEDDVVWSDEEEVQEPDEVPENAKEILVDEDGEEVEGEVEIVEEKVWKEADCRIIINVSSISSKMTTLLKSTLSPSSTYRFPPTFFEIA